MPGRGSYGPGGRWIHDRAHRIMSESEGTPKSMAYAIATQQAHKVGKSPKGFRTPEGVQTAQAKMPGPAEGYRKTAEVLGMFKEAVSEYAKGKRRDRRRVAKARNVDALNVEMPKAVPKTKATPSAPTLPGRNNPIPAKAAPEVAESVGRIKRPGKGGWQSKPGRAPIKRISKLRRYGLPAAGAALGALAIGGLAYRAHKKDKDYVDKFFKKASFEESTYKASMIRGMFDELEKISQAEGPSPAPAPGMGAASPNAAGPPGSGSNLGGSAAAAVPPPPPPPAQSPVGGGVKASGMPSASVGT